MKLRTLIRLTGLVESATRTPETPAPGAGGVRGAARRVADVVRQDGRVQGAAEGVLGRVREARASVKERADSRLEQLIFERRGNVVPDDVAGLLARRRQEREAEAARLRARQTLLDTAENPVQRQILMLVAQTTAWAGGNTPEALRYTQLLDRLAPSGKAEAEMPVHRALWTLAERRVLAVSPHGEVTASLPETGRQLVKAGTQPAG
ncbi:hypothetical protein E7T06_02040 [Deinococcus sp. Arct2-2]|uniref:hypothetical protein n=1 Tax=Deinococcus sp. Arct2-2 TaxID=2568653 RepID=UPI0010A384D1|nr:hypothetical protein [Deinococcus sp. Arct2-2]THF71759.1 hypothetical protein E7T06_02040 [Deinococcus sp. Arct2-2]